MGHWKVDQEAPSFQNMCLSLSSPEVYSTARIQVHDTCWGSERHASGAVRLVEKAANKD